MKLLILFILPILMICFFEFRVNACLQPIGSELVGEQIQVDGVPPQEFVKNLTSH